MKRAVELVAALASVLSAGCRTTPQVPDEGPHLPFHVAVVPAVLVREAGVSGEGALALELEPDRVSARLREVMESATFARATLLAPPGPQVDPSWKAWSPERWDEWWRGAARESGADLMMRSRLAYRPSVESRANARVWIEVPFFLLGGPLCWFVPDRTYAAELAIEASFCPVEEPAGVPDVGSDTVLASVSARCAPFDLHFVDRAGDDVASYATTILVPPCLLEGDRKELEDTLREGFATGVSVALADEIAAAAGRLFEEPGPYGFYLDAGAHVLRDGGTAHLFGQARLLQGAVPSLAELVVRCGAHAYSARFGEPLADERGGEEGARWVRYPFHTSFPCTAQDSHVRVELRSGGDAPRVRRYTFLVP